MQRNKYLKTHAILEKIITIHQIVLEGNCNLFKFVTEIKKLISLMEESDVDVSLPAIQAYHSKNNICKFILILKSIIARNENLQEMKILDKIVKDFEKSALWTSIEESIQIKKQPKKTNHEPSKNDDIGF